MENRRGLACLPYVSDDGFCVMVMTPEEMRSLFFSAVKNSSCVGEPSIQGALVASALMKNIAVLDENFKENLGELIEAEGLRRVRERTSVPVTEIFEDHWEPWGQVLDRFGISDDRGIFHG